MNKIKTRIIVPYAIVGTMGIFTVVASTVMKQKENQYIAEMQMNNTYVEDSTMSDSMYIVLICMGLLVGFGGFVSLPDYMSRKINTLTEKYLNEMMKKYPELEKYKDALSDKKTLNALSTLVCNGLDKSERKQVVSAVRDLKLEAELPALTEVFLNIANKHAAKHPEYVQIIKQLLQNKNLQKTYVINTSNQTEL
jgi:hypothetical protein